uniref:glycosyltransferase family 92 protein n=1 Tax=Acetatifactor sp. TaxID=1872090 RepID=UPI004056B305
MQIDYAALIKEQKKYIDKVLMKDKLRIPLLCFSSQMRAVKKQYVAHESATDEQKEFLFLADIANSIDRNGCFRFLNKLLHDVSDVLYECKYHNNIRNIKKEMRKDKNCYLSVVCIIKNEARYIKEWLTYYKIMEVDHVYLFNNGSTDNIREVLSEEIKEGYVTLIDFTGPNAQLPVYRLSAKALKNSCRWVAYIDADEFVLPTEGTLQEYLRQKEEYSGIGINWIVFGPGGHKERPEGLVTENYLYTFEDADNLLNLRIKSIVNPKQVYDVSSPHYCILKHGKYAVDENGEEISTKWMYVSGSGAAFTDKNRTQHIRINHYWTKSEQDLREKCSRGYAAGSFSPDYENIMRRLDYPQKIDKEIERYIIKIKELLRT